MYKIIIKDNSYIVWKKVFKFLTVVVNGVQRLNNQVTKRGREGKYCDILYTCIGFHYE